MTQPICYSKSEIFERLKGFNKHTVRLLMNEIIVKNRRISLEMAKREKRLTRREAEAVFKNFD